MRLRAGVDIGGTKTAVLIVDTSGQARGFAQCPTDTSSPEALVAGTIKTIDMALQQAGATRSDLEAAGIGVPGQVNTAKGEASLAVNLNITTPYPLAPTLASELGIPITIENDVRAAAWGAYHWLRTFEPLNSLAYLSIGTGIAAGVVLNGHLYRGIHDMAGEIGHISVDPAGPRCACGAIGCLEAIASGPAIAAYAAEVLPDNYRGITTEQVFNLAMQGNTLAGQVIERASYFLARAVYLLVMTYDVEKVLIGGGVTQAGIALEQPLFAALNELRTDSKLADTMLPNGLVRLAPAGYNAGLRGAMLLAPA